MAESALASIVLSFKYRLLPTRAQHRALERILEDQRQLYNAALEERIDCYKKTGVSLSYLDQCRGLTDWRAGDQQAASVPLLVQRWTIKRVDEAFRAFFRRAKGRRTKAGFPRFRAVSRWRSFGFNEAFGIRLTGRRINFKGVPGGVRVHFHRRPPKGKVLSCTFARDGKGWSVCFQMRVESTEQRQATRSIGIDVGLSSLATMSDGTLIPNPRHAKRAEKELRRRQRALARCKRGSNRRRKVRAQVSRIHRKVADTRGTHLHQVSADLVNRFDLIAVEKLNVKGLAGSMLAKSVHDASWGRLRQLLAYKAEKAGAQLIEVDPRHTSQTCPQCGQVAAKALAQRIHRCDCGCEMDRDHAAALVILGKAVAGLGAHNVAGYGERALGNANRSDSQVGTLPKARVGLEFF